MAKKQKPFNRPDVNGPAESAEEKREMRRQLVSVMKEEYPDGRIIRFLDQPTPVRSDAKPKTEEDRLRGFYPMLEEERQANPNWRE